MLANTEKLKILGGVVAGATLGSLAFIYRGPFMEIWKQDIQTYLVQSNDGATSKLKDGYFCKFDQQTDNWCEILKLDFEDKKYISAQELISAESEFDDVLIKDDFYKLKINKNKIKTDFINGKTEIQIVNNLNQDLTTLKIISLIKEETINEPEEKWGDHKLLVRANKSVFSEFQLTLNNCSIGESFKEDIDCKIYEFLVSPSNKNDLDFSKIKLVTDVRRIQAGRYYILDFSATKSSSIKAKLNKQKNINAISAKYSHTGYKDNRELQSIFNFVAKMIAHIEKNEERFFLNKALILKNNFIKNKNHPTYIIASSDSLVTSDLLSNEKNYKCSIKNDSSCTLIEITDKEKTLLQLTNAETLVTSNSDKPATQKYFKVITSNEIVADIMKWDGTEKIKVVDVNDFSKEYKKLTPLFFVEDGMLSKGKTNSSIVNEVIKKDENLIASVKSWNKYKCKLQDENTAKNCDIYKFTEKLNVENITSFLTTNIEKVSKKEDWDNKNFYAINVKGNKIIDFLKLKLNQKNKAKNLEILVDNVVIATAKISIPLPNLPSQFDSNNLSKSLLLF